MTHIVLDADTVAQSLARDVRQLVACGPRIAGSPAEQAAADYILSELRAVGLAPELLEWDAWISLPRQQTRVELADGTSIAGKGTAFAGDSGADGISAPLRRLDEPGRLDGAIAVVEGLPHLALLEAAARRGALAVIAISADEHAHYWQISPLWGSPAELADLARMAQIPALQVARGDGERLLQYGRAGGIARLVAPIESGWRRVTMPTVFIPGREAGELLVGGHFCSWGPGATDNAAGNALMLHLARRYATTQPPRFGLRLAWWTGHEQGGYAGSAHFADRFHAALAADAFAFLSVDNVGSRGATIWQVQNTSAELHAYVTGIRDRLVPLNPATRDFAQSLLPTRQDHGIPASRPARNGDQSFGGIGLASIQVSSWLGPDCADRIPGTGLPWWWHTDQDEPEYCDAGVLLRDLAVQTALVEGLINAPTLPIDPTAQAADLVTALAAIVERAPELSALEGLLTSARTYATALATTTLTDPLRISLIKALNPVLFHGRSATEFDMTRQSALLPGLRAAFSWNTVPVAHRPFAEISLRRAANRIDAAIRTALSLLQKDAPQ